MKEIIPIKKDIIFKTKIGELNNISLDHDYKINDDVVTGTVAISGTYKMTEASVIEEEFYYTIPFEVAISKRIDKDTIKIDIDDFKYTTEKDILKVNIDLELSCEETREEEPIKEEYDLDNYIDNYFEDKKINLQNEEHNEEIKDNNINTTIDTDISFEKKDIDLNNNINNITNIINSENKYYTYKVYIVREGDTIETICSKYNVDINDIKEYNNINEINVGDKIIIPQINE